MSILEKNQFIYQEKCPICLGEAKIIDRIKTINKGSDMYVLLRECTKCKHWWNDPLPKQEVLSSWYKNRSGYVVPAEYEGTSPGDVASEKIFETVTKHLNVSQFNFLEIGCGTGGLLKYFRDRSNISYGVEPGVWVTENDLNIVPNIESLPKGAMFDVVILSDVLEHVSSPHEMMKMVSEKVNNNAVVYLQFPNKDCLKAKIRKGKWGMILPFGHLHYFSSRSIDQLCKKNGFSIVFKRSIRGGDDTVIDILKRFDFDDSRVLFRFFKVLILGQILLSKDQWSLLLRKSI